MVMVVAAPAGGRLTTRGANDDILKFFCSHKSQWKETRQPVESDVSEVYTPEVSHRPWKMMVGKSLLFGR